MATTARMATVMENRENVPDIELNDVNAVDGDGKVQLWSQQHSSTKTNSQLSDTVFSLRNCSSILQNSNRRSVSPNKNDKVKGLVRQTSTPMIKSVAIIQSPDSLITSQMSSIHSTSGETDAATPSPPPPPSTATSKALMAATTTIAAPATIHNQSQSQANKSM